MTSGSDTPNGAFNWSVQAGIFDAATVAAWLRSVKITEYRVTGDTVDFVNAGDADNFVTEWGGETRPIPGRTQKFTLYVRWVQVLSSRNQVQIDAPTVQAAVEMLNDAFNNGLREEAVEDGFSGFVYRVAGQRVFLEYPNDISDDELKIEVPGG